ncbi:MAG: Acetyl-CoA:oxalate CoA-transferase [Rhodocyclaceae bacterium]|nr:Acetyl-CoA:oxalate CoA-transferase [Rhodocyclaceae bacterium]
MEQAGHHLLSGIVVVDFTQFLAGPVVTQTMAELGAEVIKIELAPTGDPGRYLPLQRDGRSGYFVQQNTAKMSLCVDIKRDEGRALVMDLLKSADVMVENYSPGVIAKLGFGWETVHALNPRLVMGSVSALGQTGPLAQLPGFDFTGQAYSGVASMVGDPDGPPALMGVAVGDVGAGMSALSAINAALVYRERTGRGTRVEASLLDFLVRSHEVNVEMYSLSGGAFKPNRCGSQSGAYAPVGYYRAPGGYVSLVVPSGLWPRFCAAMNRPELENDPRFASNELRAANIDALVRIIEDWMRGFDDVHAVVAHCSAHRIPAAPVLTVEQAIHHPHMIERESVRKVTDPIFGEITLAGQPICAEGFPRHTGKPAPLLGEHNAWVLRRYLKRSDAEIERLGESGVLAQARC